MIAYFVSKMGLDDSIKSVLMGAFTLPKIDFAHKDPQDYADAGGRASSLPIKDLQMYQLAWERGEWSVAVETYFLGNELHAILREEIPLNHSRLARLFSWIRQPDTRFTEREVHVHVHSPQDNEEVAEAVPQLTSLLCMAYRMEYGSELPLKIQETEGLVGTYLLHPKNFRKSFINKN